MLAATMNMMVLIEVPGSWMNTIMIANIMISMLTLMVVMILVVVMMMMGPGNNDPDRGSRSCSRSLKFIINTCSSFGHHFHHIIVLVHDHQYCNVV